MSNRPINVLALILGVLCAGIYSQMIPVNDQANRTISCPAPSSPGDEDQSAVADDDPGDSLDDFILLALNLLPSVAADERFQRRATMIGPPQYSESATLESQHVLLRL